MYYWTLIPILYAHRTIAIRRRGSLALCNDTSPPKIGYCGPFFRWQLNKGPHPIFTGTISLGRLRCFSHCYVEAKRQTYPWYNVLCITSFVGIPWDGTENSVPWTNVWLFMSYKHFFLTASFSMDYCYSIYRSFRLAAYVRCTSPSALKFSHIFKYEKSQKNSSRFYFSGKAFSFVRCYRLATNNCHLSGISEPRALERKDTETWR